MNGKKSRLLRSLAGTKLDKNNRQQYKVVKGSEKTHSFYKPELLMNGQTIQKLAGTFKTCTFVMDAGSRSVYQTLKKRYKNALKLPHVA